MSEEKINPEITKFQEEKQNHVQDDYAMTQKMINSQDNSETEYHPDNPIDIAHLLLSNSPTSDYMMEMDKEIKLANLDKVEQYAIYQFTSIWNDIMFLKAKQEKRLMEAKVKYGPVENDSGKIIRQNLHDVGGEDSILEEIQKLCPKTDPAFFDDAGTYKKGRFVAALSRGKYGFERIQQIRTISEYKMEQTDITEKSPGFMQRFMGGFKK